MTSQAEVLHIISVALKHEYSVQLKEQFASRRSLSLKVSSLYRKFNPGDAETAYQLSRECSTSMVTIMEQYNAHSKSHRIVSSKLIQMLEESLVILRRHCSKSEMSLITERLLYNKAWTQLDPRFGGPANKRHFDRVIDREIRRGKLVDAIRPLLLY